MCYLLNSNPVMCPCINTINSLHSGGGQVLLVLLWCYQDVLCRKHSPDKLSVLTIENMTTLRIPTTMTLMTMKILLRNMMIMRWKQNGG